MIRLTTLLLSTALASGVAAQGFGAVFTLTNDTVDNAVAVTLRLPFGTLLPLGEFSTDGTGTGGGLGSQGALATSGNDKFLFAVSPGSDEITMFRLLFGVLPLRLDTETTGDRPTSVAVKGNLVYVLNAGSDSVTGFRRQGNSLSAIPGATYSLSQAGSAAAQVGFSPDGDHLVVTERATQRISVFSVNPNGTLGTVTFNTAAAPTPFGFLFRDDGVLVVSEAVGGMPDAGVTSSYRIQSNGTLQVLSAAVPTNETAACWVAIPRQGGFAYVTNTGSGTITGYSLDAFGQLVALDADGITGDLGANASPLDFEFDPSGRFLFVLDAGNDQVRGFWRRNDGGLDLLATSINTPNGTAGLLVR
jgi:6-phosphogluconolactonase (cycloisomerase 2 family)